MADVSVLDTQVIRGWVCLRCIWPDRSSSITRLNRPPYARLIWVLPGVIKASAMKPTVFLGKGSLGIRFGSLWLGDRVSVVPLKGKGSLRWGHRRGEGIQYLGAPTLLPRPAVRGSD